MSFPPIHRVVTGHDAEGKAVVASNGPLHAPLLGILAPSAASASMGAGLRAAG